MKMRNNRIGDVVAKLDEWGAKLDEFSAYDDLEVAFEKLVASPRETSAC